MESSGWLQQDERDVYFPVAGIGHNPKCFGRVGISEEEAGSPGAQLPRAVK